MNGTEQQGRLRRWFPGATRRPEAGGDDADQEGRSIGVEERVRWSEGTGGRGGMIRRREMTQCSESSWRERRVSARRRKREKAWRWQNVCPRALQRVSFLDVRRRRTRRVDAVTGGESSREKEGQIAAREKYRYFSLAKNGREEKSLEGQNAAKGLAKENRERRKR